MAGRRDCVRNSLYSNVLRGFPGVQLSDLYLIGGNGQNTASVGRLISRWTGHCFETQVSGKRQNNSYVRSRMTHFTSKEC